MRFTTSFLPLVGLGATLASGSPAATPAMPTVRLDYSTVVAATGNSSLGYYKYQNIRVAAPPTGSLRWAKPQWPTTEKAINNGSLASADVSCQTSEDWKEAPVMVWTYGGGFSGGSKFRDTPEGLFSISKDFIAVYYNYRLGLTGLGNGPTFNHEGGTSNTALWDVQHAFEWTKKYISAFGGDTEQITAVGFSAGASQVLFQMTRFAGHAPQLFNRAYVMSPGFVPGAGHHHAEEFWLNVSSAVDCNGGHLDCMRNVDFAKLNNATNDVVKKYTYQFQPRVDGNFVADTYEAQFYQKNFNFSGPLVITHELHETNSSPWAGVNTTEDVAKYLKIFFPAITDDIVQEALRLHPESAYTSPGLRFADMKQSFDLTAHNLAVTQTLNNHTWNAAVALGPATHGTDQQYYFYSTYQLSPSTGNPTLGGPPGGGMGPPGIPVDPAIAVKMQKYMLSFILKGDPNALWKNDKLYWPMYDEKKSDSGTQLIFNTTFTVGPNDLATEKTLFWNKALWY
ncbi:carboxylesterase family protein-like protein [Delitschia confertaspora ATCC 74209]|uniref:Carboxylesterase family protein-like protein n=1 Tax=Delitschia confertaspora ATCC 74209 TaxID=1513339 RepID=A0A9P4JVP0_9PLEO|nr:carboxylesterase family protein-like protein [Delitschia confertaspora ATCC 74209]